MSISVSDIKMYHAETDTDTSVNGGKVTHDEILSGVRHNLFPRVSDTERKNGIVRYRKAFLRNDNVENDNLYGSMLYLESMSNADDFFALAKGTETDQQSDVLVDPLRTWVGCGQLYQDLTGNESVIQVQMESTDFQVPNGGVLHISSKYKVGEVIDSLVRPGDYVEYSVDKWVLGEVVDVVAYPHGIYIGNNTVYTIHSAANENWLPIDSCLTENENIGTGDGSNTTPTLSNLANITRQVCVQADNQPTITTVCGGVNRVVTVDSAGNCNGYCSAGKLNLADGTWITPITWTTAPDNGSAVYATYSDLCYSYSGNVLSIHLEDIVGAAFNATDTLVCPCIYTGTLACVVDEYGINTSGSLDYDFSTYPVEAFNKGALSDTYTLTFVNATEFNCVSGSGVFIGSGNTAANFTAYAPNGSVMFTILSIGWSGTASVGDTFTFKTHPPIAPYWLRETVPANANKSEANQIILGWYGE